MHLAPAPRLDYRPDIDGLRAIAVLATVGYHAFPEAVSGGFTGVDVFFVISGFLISGILLGSLRQGKLDIAAFYARRVRRIFPAVVVVLFGVLALGWLSLFADEYQQVGKHVAGAAAFISNLVLWKEIGYFDNAAVTKPLLHFWSLAVEEQFYLIWPVTLWLASRARINIAVVVAGTAMVSFGCGIWLSQANPSSAFYLSHTRLWELCIGALLAYRNTQRDRSTNAALWLNPLSETLVANIQSALGLLLISYGVVMLSHTHAYPGWRALIPTTGTLLILAAGPGAWLNRRVLSNRVAVSIGLISFPLYLWHWPLLSFAYIIHAGPPGLGLKTALIGLSVALAWLTYRFVEIPLRFGQDSRLKLPLLAGSLAAVGCLGGVALFLGGFPQRVPNATAETIRMNDWDYPGAAMKAESIEGIPVYRVGGNGRLTLFYGDSNLEQYGPRFVELLKDHSDQRRGAMFLTQGGAIPIDRIRRIDNNLTSIDAFLKLSANTNVDRIVIGAAWSLYFNPDKADLGLTGPIIPHYFVGDITLEAAEGRQLAANRLEEMVLQLTRQGKLVYLLSSTPAGKEFGRSSSAKGRGFLVEDPSSNKDRTVPRSTVESRLATTTQLLASVASRTGAILIDPLPHLCSADQCPIGISKDAGHLRASFVRQHVTYLDETVAD